MGLSQVERNQNCVAEFPPRSINAVLAYGGELAHLFVSAGLREGDRLVAV